MPKKVSIALITYNHENYIRQAIEGILIQDYSDYEIIIADDCSTDRTVEIIKDTVKDFQVDITYLPNEKNIGSAKNFKRLIEHCKGEYVAMLDGDDFWIDPEKLKKQVEFLENNKEYVLSFTRARVLMHSNEVMFEEYIPKLDNLNEEYVFNDVLNELFMPTSSVVYRNRYLKELPKWFEDLVVLDKPLHLLNLMHGKIKFFPLTTAVYRVHKNGVWSVNRDKKEIDFLRERLFMLEHFNKETNYVKNSEVEKTKRHVENKLLLAQIKNQDQIVDYDFEKYKHIIQFLKEKDIYIFGTGEAGKNTAILLDFLGINYCGFYDNDAKKHNTNLGDKKIMDPSQLANSYEANAYIIIASMYYKEISEQLEAYGLKETVNYIYYI